jgi:hypothetical protein
LFQGKDDKASLAKSASEYGQWLEQHYPNEAAPGNGPQHFAATEAQCYAYDNRQQAENDTPAYSSNSNKLRVSWPK